jgi:hypothetical protein
MWDEFEPSEFWTAKAATPEGMLPVEVLNNIADAVYGTLLVAKGFVAVKPRMWVRSRLEFARDVFSLDAVKGASYVPSCGLSLNFAPHVQSGVLRWHRTAKSVISDLSLPLPEPSSGLPGAVDQRDFTLTRLGSAKFNEDVARRCAAGEIAAALAQFARISTLAELPEVFERERHRSEGRGGFVSFPQFHIGLAFTLARLNRLPEARLELAKSREMAETSMAQRLSAELEKASSLAAAGI